MRMRTAWFLISILVSLSIFACSAEKPAEPVEKEMTETAEAQPAAETKSSFDHTGLSGTFTTGQEATAVCLSCHTDQANDFMQTVHWTWEGDADKMVNWDGTEEVGKMTTINNFCVAVESNEPRCTQCHAGYGWKDDSFDFTKAENIDCLICHDTSGQYKKDPKTAGNPMESVDLLASVQSVGMPTRSNCGSCHFKAGGGDNVKKGDLYSALASPSREADVHMGGMDFSCQTCHTTENHVISGESMHVGVSNVPTSCQDCHTSEAVHSNSKLNEHTSAVACQTCHIPAFSRQKATKTWWDWSTAGRKDADGKNIVTKDADGNQTYNTMKGDFVYEKDVRPTYACWNGTFERMLTDDTFDTLPVPLATPVGSIDDPESKLYPFKVMRGKQGVDAVNKTVLVPHLFGKGSGENPYWMKWDWDLAFEEGMAYAGLDYSGSYDWVETEMYMSINHEVAPASEALSCMECHNGGIDFKALGYSDDPMNGGGR